MNKEQIGNFVFTLPEDRVSEFYSRLLNEPKLLALTKKRLNKPMPSRILTEITNAILNNFPAVAIRYLTDSSFDVSQICEIYLGFEHNLTPKQVQIYANKDYDSKKMSELRTALENGIRDDYVIFCRQFKHDCIKQIRLGLEGGLFFQQVKIYAKDSYSREQMLQIRLGLEFKLKLKSINVYANPIIPAEIMETIRWALVGGIDPMKLKRFCSANKFNKEQLEIIFKAMGKNLSMEQILYLARTEFNSMQMEQLYLGFKSGLSIESVGIYANKNYSAMQMNEIRLGLESNLNLSGIMIYCSSNYNDKQMKEIRIGLENGLPIEKVILYAWPTYTSDQMYEIRLGIEHGLSNKVLDLYTNSIFSAEQMKELRLSLTSGIAFEEVCNFADPCINSIQMLFERKTRFNNDAYSTRKKIYNLLIN